MKGKQRRRAQMRRQRAAVAGQARDATLRSELADSIGAADREADDLHALSTELHQRLTHLQERDAAEVARTWSQATALAREAQQLAGHASAYRKALRRFAKQMATDLNERVSPNDVFHGDTVRALNDAMGLTTDYELHSYPSHSGLARQHIFNGMLGRRVAPLIPRPVRARTALPGHYNELAVRQEARKGREGERWNPRWVR